MLYVMPIGALVLLVVVLVGVHRQEAVKSMERVLELQKEISFYLSRLKELLVRPARSHLTDSYNRRFQEAKAALGILTMYQGTEKQVDWPATARHLEKNIAPLRTLYQEITDYVTADEHNAANLVRVGKLYRFVWSELGESGDEVSAIGSLIATIESRVWLSAGKGEATLEVAQAIAEAHARLLRLCALQTGAAGDSQEAHPDWRGRVNSTTDR
jgi:hypothetical protein